MRDQLFHLEPGSGATLQSRLRQMLVAAILQGQIPAGEALPSCRKLARSLSVARNTVSQAYQDLVEEGFLQARERRGYFVNGDILKGRVGSGPATRPAPPAGPDWVARFRLRPSGQRNIVKPRDWQAYPYPFIYGQYDFHLFPVAAWRECTRQALSLDAVRDWAVDHFTDDDPKLVEQIRARLLPRRGVLVGSDEILVTVGAQHAVYLLATLLFGAKTRVGFEDPGYADARNIAALLASELVALPVDREGLVVGAELDRCDYVYVTPSHQFPTTSTLSLARRRNLIARANARDFVIIEDDYESEINHLGVPTPALKSLDTTGRVIFLASLSKTLAPGLRLGYMVASRELIREARALRRLMLRHPPANNQRTIAIFLAHGYHDSLLRRLSRSYRERWETMNAALGRYLPECRFQPTTGGTAYWIEGPKDLDTDALEFALREKGVLIEPGAIHFAGEDPPRRYFRLGFSSIARERIEAGIKLIGETIEEQLG